MLPGGPWGRRQHTDVVILAFWGSPKIWLRVTDPTGKILQNKVFISSYMKGTPRLGNRTNITLVVRCASAQALTAG